MTPWWWTTFALLAIGFGLILRRVGLTHDHFVEHVTRLAHRLQEVVEMSTQDAVNAVVAQLGKAKAEIVAKIADVQAQLDAAGVPAEQVDLSALEAVAQSLDDIVPDAPVVEEEPVVEAPVEEPVEEAPVEEV